MEIIKSSPIKDRMLGQVQELLAQVGLSWDDRIQTTVALMEGDQLVATGSRDRNLLKCIAASPLWEGEGVIATVITQLVQDALEAGQSHLFLYTKPQLAPVFRSLGFYTILATGDVVLMENLKDGIQSFVRGLESGPRQGREGGAVGAIVANCNPFTNGHLYLITTAAAQCGLLHLFILSEDRSDFPTPVRMELVRAGVRHLPNVLVHPTGPYLISNATFPTYFLKENQQAEAVHCQLDLLIFLEYFARPLGITKRFVGSEPFCPITSFYNRQMQLLLPPGGVEVVELPRVQVAGTQVSASQVRRLLKEGRLEDIRPLVPPATYAYLEQMEAGHGG